jgi:N-acetyl-anhydromuramoyl-L-alanine amidase
VPKRRSWADGRWAGAKQHHSPNFGPRPPDVVVSLAVVHAISLPPGVWRGDAVLRLFTNTLDWSADPYFESLRDTKVSAHFFVRRSGKTLQLVSCEQRAWHAGVSTWQGRDNCNDWSIGIELEGLDGQTFESAQYRALTRLLRRLRARYGLTEVAGHQHVAPGRKADPGPGFDWRRLKQSLNGVGLGFPGQA